MNRIARTPHVVVAGWDGVVAAATTALTGLGLGVTVIVSVWSPASAAAPGAQRAVSPPASARIVRGSPSRRKTLEEADVTTAAALLIALPMEEAAAVTSAARALQPTLRVIASTGPGDSRPDAWSAGADDAIDVREEAGKQLAAIALADGGDPPPADDAGPRVGIVTATTTNGLARLRLADVRATLTRLSIAGVVPAGDGAAALTADEVTIQSGDGVIVIGAPDALRRAGARDLEIPIPPPRDAR